MELEELKNIGNSIGFFKVEELNIDKIKLLPEVRQMCSTDKCHMYGRNWSCPPAEHWKNVRQIFPVIKKESLCRQKGNWKMNLTERE